MIQASKAGSSSAVQSKSVQIIRKLPAYEEYDELLAAIRESK